MLQLNQQEFPISPAVKLIPVSEYLLFSKMAFLAIYSLYFGVITMTSPADNYRENI